MNNTNKIIAPMQVVANAKLYIIISLNTLYYQLEADEGYIIDSENDDENITVVRIPDTKINEIGTYKVIEKPQEIKEV